MRRHNKRAFSVTELMVVVSVVGILVMLAIPRYQAFMVMSRRGEAKSNLSHIISLQESYRIDYFGYYDGLAMTGVNGIGGTDCLNRAGVHGCGLPDEDKGLCNHLGFWPEAVGELRYRYQVIGSGSAAKASSSSGSAKEIFPDCDGGGASECGCPKGDALTQTVNGNPLVCRNITKYCTN